MEVGTIDSIKNPAEAVTELKEPKIEVNLLDLLKITELKPSEKVVTARTDLFDDIESASQVSGPVVAFI